MCHVIIRTGDIAAEVMAGLLRSIAMDVAAPTVSGFLLRLAPGIVAAVCLRRVGSHIAARPLRAGGQAEVDEVRVVVVGAGEVGLWGIPIQYDSNQFHYVRDGYNTVVVHIASWRTLCIARDCNECQRKD